MSGINGKRRLVSNCVVPITYHVCSSQHFKHVTTADFTKLAWSNSGHQTDCIVFSLKRGSVAHRRAIHNSKATPTVLTACMKSIYLLVAIILARARSRKLCHKRSTHACCRLIRGAYYVYFFVLSHRCLKGSPSLWLAEGDHVRVQLVRRPPASIWLATTLRGKKTFRGTFQFMTPRGVPSQVCSVLCVSSTKRSSGTAREHGQKSLAVS